MTLARLLLATLLMIFHIIASYYYYTYSLTSVADAYAYYYLPSIWKDRTIGISTVLVADFVETLRVGFGASFLDCFLLFQSFGFLGMMILARTFVEIEESVGVSDTRGYLGLLALPSLNFWTAAIGKDALLFLAIALCVWSVLKVRRRIVWLAAGLALMMFFRAHIALMAAAALAAASVFGASVSVGRKLAMLGVAAIGGAFAVGAVQDTLGVDATSVSAVGEFLDKQNSVYATVAGTTSLGSAPFAVRVVSLLFRPFFFDANGILGLIASAENLLVVALTLFLIIRWRDLAHLVKHVFFIRFAVIFAFFILFALSLIYYNVGLGLRQRVMAYPMILSTLVAMWALRRRFIPASNAPPAPAAPVRTSRTTAISGL